MQENPAKLDSTSTRELSALISALVVLIDKADDVENGLKAVRINLFGANFVESDTPFNTNGDDIAGSIAILQHKIAVLESVLDKVSKHVGALELL